MSVTQARNAVIAAFGLSGWTIATWFTRLPELRDQLGLTPGGLGRVLLIGALGTMVALPLAGLLVDRIGATRTVAAAAVLAGSGTVLIGLSAEFASPAVAAVGLFCGGFGVASWDVALNVQGAEVERRLGRTLMPRLHAGYSVGTVVGAGAGALAQATGLPVSVHLGAVGLIACAGTLVASRWLLPVTRERTEARAAGAGLRAAWREPHTLLLGALLLSCALAEGIAYDWLAIGLVDGYHVSNAVGAAGYAVFVTAMTACRIWGAGLVDRFGRVWVLRGSAVLAAVGVLLVVFGGALPVGFAGAALWGVGVALGFPLGMSAAADDPARAAARVSVISSIGYTAFLAGPPLLGWLGDQFGVQRALLTVVVAVAVSAAIAGAARPRVPTGDLAAVGTSR